jgi:hypothetical protein
MTRFRRTEGVTFTCRGPGALLSLPCGGQREDATYKKLFKESIRDHAVDWFNWSRTADLDVDRMEALILVTGCTLVNSYAAAVFDDHVVDAQFSLVSRPLKNGGVSFHRSSIRGTMEYHDSQLELNLVCFPAYITCRALNFLKNIPTALRNRCVFIRGFRAKRVVFWTKPIRAAAEPRPDDFDHPDDPAYDRIEEIQVNQIPYDPEVRNFFVWDDGRNTTP